MKQIALALALVAAYVAGTITPHASAACEVNGLISELRGIRSELTEIRRAIWARK